jgi:hypothetical protein
MCANLSGGVTMTLREELLKIQEEVRAKYTKQKEKLYIDNI